MRDPLQDIMEERARQDEKWGEQNHDPGWWLAILGEEYGEACKAAVEWEFGEGTMNDFRKEMIQTAAVALSILECGERNGWWK